MAGKKFGVKKAIAIVSCLTVAGIGLFFGGKFIYQKLITEPTPRPTPVTPVYPVKPIEAVKLEAPVIKYNAETNFVSWNKIENAINYKLTINGEEFETTETSFQTNLKEQTDFKITVQALGDGKNYEDSSISVLEGYRENQDFVAFNKFNQNVVECFADYKDIDGTYNFHKILNVECVDNKVNVLFEYNYAEIEDVNFYKTATFDLNGVYEMQDNSLQSVAKASDYFKDLDIETDKGVMQLYYDSNGCYEKLLQDTKLNGKLKDYLDQGYTATKLYSEVVLIGWDEKRFAIDSVLKLSKNDDIKIVKIKHTIDQKFNKEYEIFQYMNAYVDGTAEDVTIQETSFEELTNSVVVWHEAQEKFKFTDLNAKKETNTQIETMFINLNNGTYKLTFPAYSLER